MKIKLKYLLIPLSIFLGFIIFFTFTYHSHRNLPKEEVCAFNSVSSFLARLEINQPITIEEASKFIQVNRGNAIDGILLSVYKIDSGTIDYSLALELIRINKNIFAGIEHKSVTLIARRYSSGREPGLVCGVLKISDISILQKYSGLNWTKKTKVGIFPILHTNPIAISISGIVINGQPLIQILGIDPKQGFVDNEKEIIFLQHITKIMPALKENPIIKNKLTNKKVSTVPNETFSPAEPQ